MDRPRCFTTAEFKHGILTKKKGLQLEALSHVLFA